MEFKLDTKVYFGEDALNRLSEINIGKALVVSDPFLIENGRINVITKRLKAKNIDYDIFSDILPDTPIEKVSKGLEIIRNNEPDTIIAIGGGSAIDTSKAMKLFNNKLFGENRLKLIAIPTTSGTGSEVTNYSVVKDKDDRKYALSHDIMTPDIAILDTSLVMSVPKNITVWTGLDVLTHSLEAYVSENSNDITDILAIKSIEDVFKYLPKIYKDGEDLEGRNKMHLSSMLAGIAFNNAGLGINHSIAHVLGGKYNIPHGKINGILIPYVIEKNSSKMEKNKYIEIAEKLDIPGYTDDMKMRNFLIKINRFISSLGMETSLKELNIDEVEYISSLDEMAEQALLDGCTKSNPVKLTKADIIEIFKNVYYGK